MERLRQHITEFLAAHSVGLLCGTGLQGAWALPVRYQNDRLKVVCWLPRWADALYYLEQDPHVLLLVVDSPLPEGSKGLCWLHYDGLAEMAVTEAGVDELYQTVHLTPRRIELFDERKGWGVRETLDIL